jgi:undecaprenyl-diphosphatase
MKRWREHRILPLWPRVTRLGRPEPSILLRVLLVASALWAFAILADEVMEGETHAFDRTVLLAMRSPGDPTEPWGPRWFTEVVRDYTALGSVGILTFMTLAVIGFLLLQGKTRVTVLVVIAVGAGCSSVPP